MKKGLKSVFAVVSASAILSLIVAGCGTSTQQTTAPANNTQSTSTATSQPAASSQSADTSTSSTQNYGTSTQAKAYLDLTVVGANVAQLGPDGKTHDTFLPADFTLEKGVPTQITIRNYDEGPHTLTAPDLGINIQIPGHRGPNIPSVTTVTVTANKAGSFKWQCELPCDGKAGGWAMQPGHPGFMQGTIKVVDDNKQYVYATVVGSGLKLGWDGKTHDTYLPANFTFVEGKQVVMQVANFDEGPHTFTVPGLGINLNVPGHKGDHDPSITTFTFTPTKTGLFKWTCNIPCDGKANGWGMSELGYMQGTVAVVPAASAE